MKTDLTKVDKPYYSALREPKLITLAPHHYLSVVGAGDPSDRNFANHVEALYSVAYTLKFMSKAAGHDFVVPKLEGLWWYDESRFKDISAEAAPTKVPRSEWEYRLLIRLPDHVDEALVQTARQEALHKKRNTQIAKVEWFRLSEGKCVQILHEGPYDQEPQTLSKIKSFCDKHQLSPNGRHHEIYLSDFRKTEPEKLRTILREPVK